MKTPAWILSFIALTIASAWTSSGFAIPTPALQQVSLEGRTRLDAESTRYFKVKVGREDGTKPNSPLLATFQNSKGERVAHCRVTRFEKSRARTPKYLGLECTTLRSDLLGSEVGIAWEKAGVTLKVGNWLTGLQSVAVEIERDTFSAPHLQNHATELAQIEP